MSEAAGAGTAAVSSPAGLTAPGTASTAVPATGAGPVDEPTESVAVVTPAPARRTGPVPTWLPGLVAATLVAATVVAFVTGLTGPARPAAALGPGPVTIELRVRFSRFQPDQVSVRPGTEVTFVITNDDPINHEFIVGDAGVHARHEAGTEPYHPPRPGEVSIAAGTTAQTTFAFPEVGPVVYACHLPGHFAYGMRGTVTVTAAP
jgi:plastocyanin